MIERGKKLCLEYAVFLENGKVIDTNVGEDPLVFKLGDHQILPALENEITKANIGEIIKITLTPDKAYGEIDKNAYHEVALEAIPEELRYQGASISVVDNTGNQFNTTISMVGKESVVMDFNHPLAGKTLTFELKVIKVEQY